MTREIKFRMWSIKDKFMDDTPVVYKGAPCTIDTEGKVVWMPQDDTVLMQYTGLKDKNGKEIYEGDIMKVLDRDWSDAEKDTKLYIVYWHIGGFQLVSKIGIEEKKKDNPNIYNKDWLETVIYKEYGRDRFEVIGNIYENPELLTNK